MKMGKIERGILLSLIVGGMYSGEAFALQYGIYNNGGTIVKTEAALTVTVENATDKTIGIGNMTAGGSITVNDVVITSKSGTNEAVGIFNANSDFIGKNLNITAASNSGAGVWGINAAGGTFTAENIDMNLSNKGAEIYGIINTGGTNFKAGNITIKGDTEGNFIGITHKLGDSTTFDAGNITIDGIGKGYLVGIENQIAHTMGMKDVTIKLTKKENGGGYVAGMIGISNPNANFKANNTTIILDNANSNDKTTGINVGSKTADIQGDLQLNITGKADGDIVGVIGKTEVTGNVDADLSGGKNIIGINGAADIDKDVTMKIGSLGSAYGINTDAGKVDVGGALTMDIVAKNGVAAGIASTDTINVDGNLNINIHDTSADSRMAAIMGNTNAGGKINLGGTQNNIKVEGSSVFAEGIFGGAKFADNSVTNITLKNTKDTFLQTHGIYDRDDKGFNLGANAVLNVDVKTTGTNTGGNGSSEGVFGLLLTNVPESTESLSQEGSKINVTVYGTAVSQSGHHGTVGIAGSIKAAGDVGVEVKSENGIGIGARSAEDISEYKGDVIVKTNKGSALATIGHSDTSKAIIVIDPAEGKKVQLEGDVKHFTSYGTKEALIDVKFKTADSFLTGASIGSDANNRTTNLSFENASTWNMTGDSTVDNLVNNTNATINMTRGAATLTAENYSGTGGNFILDTDLASETDGDKVTFAKAEAGTTNVQVRDASLLTGQEVTGTKNLLLITDNTVDSVAKFQGKSLNAGGLWDVTPTIKNGLEAFDDLGNAVGSKNEWYLTKVEKEVNNDTTVSLTDRASVYNQWSRLNNDSLRKRLGDLRYKDAEDGVWVRYNNGKLAGNGYEQHYHTYQGGFDKTNGNNAYGIAFDRQESSQSYTFGNGEGTTNAVNLYYTNYTASGSYLDAILKYGRINSDYNTSGDYPDGADYNSNAYSLSFEYGKTNNYKDGYFFEPKVQLTYGHISAENYYTNRGTRVEESAVKSLIGKIGFVAGRKIGKDSDYYFKAGWFKEFKGDRDVHLAAANGENMYKSENYGDSWFEIGLGGNVRIAPKTHLYGDIEKSIGADIQKKYQINAGIRWEF